MLVVINHLNGIIINNPNLIIGKFKGFSCIIYGLFLLKFQMHEENWNYWAK